MHNAKIIDGIAGGTISKGQFIKYAAGGWVACSSQGEKSDGIAFSDAVSGGPVAVQVGQLVAFKNGAGAVSDGDNLTTGTGGLAEEAASGDNVRLRAVGDTAAGAYGTALWIDSFAVA